ncbi:MAG TPA: four-carbon acid sugar kinase family protein, partial [Acidobacteriaceae bacterium]|nr:four-carbon acid sugar kinase family protein [Acidobacteriaceae bacterium]
MSQRSMDLLYTFYGDDFTGSTDVLEQLATHGVPAVLFLSPPTDSQLRAFAGVRAIGIAGDSRSRSPEWMSANLPQIFSALAALGAPVLHYKVCSTFDSSPTVGSIGRAIDIGIDTIHPRFVPIVVGAPHLRRFVHEGRLFAAAPDGEIHRIDRHPMRHHPVTPMREADLRRHLAKQTSVHIGLLDYQTMSSADPNRELQRQLLEGARAVLFDTVDRTTLHAAGELIWKEAQQQPLFSASSSGLTAALLSAWKQEGLLPAPDSHSAATAAEPLLVISGSCSVATERQIRWALQHGYHGIRIDTARLANGAAELHEAIRGARESLSAGKHTVLYTSLGVP